MISAIQSKFKVGDSISKYDDVLTTRIITGLEERPHSADSYVFGKSKNLTHLTLSINFVENIYVLTDQLKDQNPEYFL